MRVIFFLIIVNRIGINRNESRQTEMNNLRFAEE